MQERGQFLLDYIELLQNERVHEAKGFRHVAPGVELDVREAHTALDAEASSAKAARGHDRWVINKLRALNSWYTKGIDNGSHLRVAINAADSIPALRAIVEDFFFSPVPTISSRS